MSYFLDNRFYYYRHHKGEWRTALLKDNRFQIETGLSTPLEELVDQCGMENIVIIPEPEDLLNEN